MAKYYPIYTSPPDGVTLEEWRYAIREAAAHMKRTQTEYVTAVLGNDPLIGDILSRVTTERVKAVKKARTGK